jgi:transglutaminase-like putative cysteine protease
MRFTVRHDTLYRYSAPVRLGDQLLRLKPYGVHALDHRYEITPTPVWREDGLSAFGMPETRVGFAGETDVLHIVSRFTCETGHPTPVSDQPNMATYLHLLPEDSVTGFARDLLAEAGDVPRFLELLTETLYRRTDRHIRPTGYAQTAEETLRIGRGACRDLAVLFIAACRSLGIPARFVSGYQAKAETPDGKRHLHAWPEVWLSGVGWQGYDPTHGVAVADGHVALSAAPDQMGTMPIEGGFWGDGVSSELEFGLEIEVG